ncbi:MAG: hypothetical protein JXR73_18420 [Candidatus Omnitrophica bacterium]|nr:hypothetical protein [Candidatus Omnitrophota bacterium]
MKPDIEIISVFTRNQDEAGREYFCGVLDPSVFKKAKQEIHIILMPGSQLPSSLIGSRDSSQESLYMFAKKDSGRD